MPNTLSPLKQAARTAAASITLLATLAGCAGAPQVPTAQTGLRIGDEITGTVAGTGERVCGAIWEFDGAGNAQVVVAPHKSAIATVRLSDARKGCVL